MYKSEKIVSNLVISESITLIGSLLGGKIAKQLYDNIKDNYEIYDENRLIYDNSIYTFLNYDGSLSLADSVSLEIMKEMGINKIASFDSDFDKVKEFIGFFNYNKSLIFSK